MQRETVWLVEDEQGIADTLVYMLQQEGFAVEFFERAYRRWIKRACRFLTLSFSMSACLILAVSNCVASCWRSILRCLYCF